MDIGFISEMILGTVRGKELNKWRVLVVSQNVSFLFLKVGTDGEFLMLVGISFQ